jgi:ATP-dependent exoDNAse (exonuclease V) alpha subunit
MNPMLSQRIAKFNAELDAVNAAIQIQASSTLALKKLLLERKLQNEKQLFNAFSEETEDAAEKNKVVSQSPVSLEQAKEENASLAPIQDILAKAQKEAADPLGSFEELEEDDSEVDPDSLAQDYESEIELKEQGKQESFALNIVLNPKQLIAKEMAMQGKSYCLIGAAGTGKTTAQRSVAEALLQDKRLSISKFKIYDKNGARQYVQAPSIAFCAFTRRAAGNLKKAVHKSPLLAKELEHNIMTIHALLEFEPETYEDYNEEGRLVEKFRFAPMRTAENPLDITHLVIEEASMLDAYSLWKHLYAALPAGVQIIFIGDINQLPPVFGPSILNYALVQLPIVELTEVYRNQGIVLENAHNILKGDKLKEDPNFVIVRGKSPVQVGQAKLAATLGSLFNQWLDHKGNDGLPEYDPEDCIILSPFNKQDLGTINMNNWIAQHLGQRRKAIVHEVIAGFSKLYLAIGDKVMVNKMDGVITDIVRNPNYHGKEPQIAGSDLTRFGVRVLGAQGQDTLDEIAGGNIDYSNFSLQELEDQKGERKQQASHIVFVTLENGKLEELAGAGDFGEQSFSLGYCLTVHKAQGSEWRKVFILLHKDHATMLYRELFYTGVTRARTKVTIVAKDHIIDKAIKNQRIKGDSIKDKIEYFNSGIMDNAPEPIQVLKQEAI